MSDVADEIREDIEATRADLDEKIHQLSAKAHQAVDLRHHVAQRPWVALGLAAAAGFFLGGRRRPGLASPQVGTPVTVMSGRPEFGFLGDAALLVLTAVAKNAVRGGLQSFGWGEGPMERPRTRRVARPRPLRRGAARNGDHT